MEAHTAMSFEALTWAFEQTTPSSASKLVLLALARCASDPEWLAWPSVAHVASLTQQDRKTVLAGLRALQGANLIGLAGSAGRTNQVNRWRLMNSTVSGTGTKSGTGTGSSTGTSTRYPVNQYQKRDTQQVIEQVKEQGRLKRHREPKAEVTFADWLATVAAAGEDAIPDTDAVFAYGDKVRLSRQQLGLAWEAMKSRYADDRKTKYKDWRRTFLNAVKGNWFKLWYATDDGFALTTAGKQKQREVEAMKEAA